MEPSSRSAMVWLEKYAARYGDKLPDSTKVHLPMCVTKTSLYNQMKEELEDVGETDHISESHFLRLWRTTMGHIAIPKVKWLKSYHCEMMKKENLSWWLLQQND